MHSGKMIAKSLAEKLTGVKLSQSILFTLAASEKEEKGGKSPRQLRF